MINLDLILSFEKASQLKAHLWSSLGAVKSVYRVEAMARGLGFQSNAALRDACRHGEALAKPDGKAFVAFLGQRGVATNGLWLYRAVARIALDAVLQKNTQLSLWGHLVGPPRRHFDGRWETAEEHYARFMQERNRMIDDDGIDQFMLALALVQRIPSTRTIRSGTGSYRLKHIAENARCEFPCGQILGPRYVANGALIAAAVHEGFRYKLHRDHRGYEEPNVSFNMHKSAVDDLDCQIRPRGALAQDRRRRALATSAICL